MFPNLGQRPPVRPLLGNDQPQRKLPRKVRCHKWAVDFSGYILSRQKCIEASLKNLGLLYPALPDVENAPVFASQLSLSPDISYDISFSLVLPEFPVCGGGNTAVSAGMHVPEAAMYEDCGLPSGHHYVRLARQVFTVKTIPNAHFA